jgi:hypothetical protein
MQAPTLTSSPDHFKLYEISSWRWGELGDLHVGILLLGTLSKTSVSYSIQRLHFPLAGSLLHKGEAEV